MNKLFLTSTTSKRGFTLTEMLTVVLIVGILMAVALPQYRRTVLRARANEAIAMLSVLAKTADRLSVSFGYKNVTALGNKYDFLRTDMLDSNALPCQVFSDEIVCEHFTYTYGADASGFYFQACQTDSSTTHSVGGAAVRTALKIYPDRTSTDENYITCSGTESICDLYGYPKESDSGC